MMLRETLLATAGLCALAQLSGCATADATRAGASETNIYVEQLEAARQRVSGLEAELRGKDRLLQANQAELDARSRSSGAAAAGPTSLFPPNPEPGSCYARVLLPAQYQTSTQRVLKREAGERVEIIPAQFEIVAERVLVKEASTELEVVPAVYDEVQERVRIKPASVRLVEVPAEYETVTEQVLDKAAHTVWKRGPAARQIGNVISETVTDTGEVMCLVEVPATYKTVATQVLARPARTDRVEIPAEYETVTRRVVVQPATTREVTIPAEYRTVQTTRQVRAAEERRIEIPAEYETVTQTAKISDEQLEWRSVLCEVNMTPSNIVALQTALSDSGYYKGPIDGIIGPLTLGASNAFAKDRGLPGGSNYVTLEVVEALGLAERMASL